MDSFFSMMMVLVILGGVGYMILHRSGKSDNPNNGRDAFFYIIAFLTLMPLFWAIADLFRVVLEQLWGSGSSSYNYGVRNTSYYYEQSVKKISMRLATLVVALPVYAFHWFKANSRSKEEMDIASRKTYTMAVLILSTILILTMGTWLVYQGFNSMMGLNTMQGTEMAFALPYTVMALAVWLGHYRIMHESEVKKETRVGIEGKVEK